MKALLYGRYGSFPKELKSDLEKQLTIVDSSPDIIITYGGDGTLIGAERDYPCIPKLPLKDSLVCRRCVPLEPLIAINLLLQNRLTLVSFDKVTAQVKGKTMSALNDLVVRNKLPNVALRFSVKINQELFNGLIGDGLVISTVFGATGYFQSITKTTFDRGFGVAFNNLVNHDVPLSKGLDNLDSISITIDREVAVLSADNDPELIELFPEDRVDISLSQDPAKIYTFLG